MARAISLASDGAGFWTYLLGSNDAFVVESISFVATPSNFSDDDAPIVQYADPTGKLIGQSFMFPAIRAALMYDVYCSFGLDMTSPAPVPLTVASAPAAPLLSLHSADPARFAGLPSVELGPNCAVQLFLYETQSGQPLLTGADAKPGIVSDAVMWVEEVETATSGTPPPLEPVYLLSAGD